MITINLSTEVDQTSINRILESLRADPMAGWIDLPRQINMEELTRVKSAAKKIQEESEVLVCIGIGGSYLGHRAVIDALRPQSEVEIIYAGNSLSKRELMHALDELGERDFSINVISKSGTTLEPAIAFEAFKAKLIEKYGAEAAADRIYATTDTTKGALHDEAANNHYHMFAVPDNIGGRYSVLSPVGLLPIAVAGVDIDELLAGAAGLAHDFATPNTAATHPAIQYAAARYNFGMKGYDTEVFASFEPATAYFNEWLRQLFGESEGKMQRGVWPASVIYSTDLHSLGQFMQEGRRNLWETIIDYPTDEMNQKVVNAVKIAHPAGGIPVIVLGVPSFDARGFGELIYFFEMSCAISSKMFGVNPFDQPGVEAYKAELKKLLG